MRETQSRKWGAISDSIRNHVLDRYIEPARQRGLRTVRVRTGDIEKQLGLKNQMPQICSALRAQKFLREHSLRIVDVKAPRSGQSSTVEYEYALTAPSERPSALELFDSLSGSMRDVIQEHGGAEGYLAWVREGWDG